MQKERGRTVQLIKSQITDKVKKLQTRIDGNPKMKAVILFFANFFDDNIPGIAAETAFFLLLSVFPLSLIIASTLSRYSVDLTGEMFNYLLPSSVAAFLNGILSQVPLLSAFSMIPVVATLWSASAGIWALMRGICRAYTGDSPKRPLLKRFAALFFVIVFIAVVAIGLAVWIIGESMLMRFDGFISAVVFIIKYAVAFISIFLFIMGLYIYTPGYDIKIRHMIPGAVAAAGAWLLTNKGFEVYISHFSNYSVLYGSVGTFLGLIMWLFVISIVILTGAEINSAILLYKKSLEAQDLVK